MANLTICRSIEHVRLIYITHDRTLARTKTFVIRNRISGYSTTITDPPDDSNY